MSAILENIFNNIIDLLPDIPIGSKGYKKTTTPNFRWKLGVVVTKTFILLNHPQWYNL